MYVSLIRWPTCEFGSSTNVTTRQDLCLDSWWTRPGCRVKKIIGQNLTQVCEFERQSGEVHVWSLPFHSHVFFLCHQPGNSCDVFRHAKLSGVDGISMLGVVMDRKFQKAQIPEAICACTKHPATLGYLGNIAVMPCDVSQLEGQDVCRWLGFPKAGVPAVLTQRCWDLMRIKPNHRISIDFWHRINHAYVSFVPESWETARRKPQRTAIHVS